MRYVSKEPLFHVFEEDGACAGIEFLEQQEADKFKQQVNDR